MEGTVEAAPSDLENQNTQLETLTEELDKLIPLSDSCCIYRVPHRFRRLSEEIYTPQVISIGPLHHGKKELKAMEEHKKRYLQYFMLRGSNLSLKDYFEKVKAREERLRSCYSETIDFTTDEFARIILVDAIFLIELLFRYWHHPTLLDEKDSIFGKPKMIHDIWPDLMILENQLPYFILEDLFDPDMFPCKLEKLSLMFLYHHFVYDRVVRNAVGDPEEVVYSFEVEVQHFVDLLRKLYRTSPLKSESAEGRTVYLTAPAIEELHRGGVKLAVGSAEELFEIRFTDGILEISKIEVTDRTELKLKNLVAFEQCVYTQQKYMSDYLAMMDQLVKSTKDVELLVESGIIVNGLGGYTELAAMMNRLSTGVGIYPRNSYYGTLCKELNKFCNSKRHKWISNLKQNYFNSPWAAISFVAAVILLILTVIQTFCSIISLK